MKRTYVMRDGALVERVAPGEPTDHLKPGEFVVEGGGPSGPGILHSEHGIPKHAWQKHVDHLHRRGPG